MGGWTGVNSRGSSCLRWEVVLYNQDAWKAECQYMNNQSVHQIRDFRYP